MKLRRVIHDWQTIDYLSAFIIGLLASAVAMLLFGHPWYSLYLAAAALLPLTGIGLLVVIVAVFYDKDDALWESEYDRKLWRK